LRYRTYRRLGATVDGAVAAAICVMASDLDPNSAAQQTLFDQLLAATSTTHFWCGPTSRHTRSQHSLTHDLFVCCQYSGRSIASILESWILVQRAESFTRRRSVHGSSNENLFVKLLELINRLQLQDSNRLKLSLLRVLTYAHIYNIRCYQAARSTHSKAVSYRFAHTRRLYVTVPQR